MYEEFNMPEGRHVRKLVDFGGCHVKLSVVLVSCWCFCPRPPAPAREIRDRRAYRCSNRLYQSQKCLVGHGTAEFVEC